jgi:hypothetical protein
VHVVPREVEEELGARLGAVGDEVGGELHVPAPEEGGAGV